MAKIPLRTVTKPPADVSVIKHADPSVPFSKGIGANDYVCGGCGNLILAGGMPGQITNIVVQCGKCGAYNLMP